MNENPMNENPTITGTPEDSIRFMVAGGEMLRVDQQGLHYNGQTVADGGAAHAAWMTTVKLMHSASFLGANVTPQALREFVEWASEIFARYASLKPDASDTPEVQEETAESIQRDQAYLDAFVAACKEAQDTRQSALETSRRIDLEENQRKNNVALDTLSAAVDELKKENDALRADLAKARAELRVARHKLGPECDVEERTVAESIEIMKKDWQMERSHVTKLILEGTELKKERDVLKAKVDIDRTLLLTLRQINRDLTAERDAARAELVVLGSACDKFRAADNALRLDRDAAKRELAETSAALDAAKRELAETSAALDVVLRERSALRLQIDRWRSWSSTPDGEARA
jgi:chromosome segregation ATPase